MEIPRQASCGGLATLHSKRLSKQLALQPPCACFMHQCALTEVERVARRAAGPTSDCRGTASDCGGTASDCRGTAPVSGTVK